MSADLRHVSPPASDTAEQAAKPATYPTTLYPEIEPYETGMLDVGSGHKLYYEQCGNPDGVPCVFLHGGPGAGCDPRSRRFFDPKFYRIVVFDQRGSGRSVPNAADDLAGEICMIIRALAQAPLAPRASAGTQRHTALAQP